MEILILIFDFLPETVVPQISNFKENLSIYDSHWFHPPFSYHASEERGSCFWWTNHPLDGWGYPWKTIKNVQPPRMVKIGKDQVNIFLPTPKVSSPCLVEGPTPARLKGKTRNGVYLRKGNLEKWIQTSKLLHAQRKCSRTKEWPDNQQRWVALHHSGANSIVNTIYQLATACLWQNLGDTFLL